MDLAFYYWHRANHEVGLLWRFHSAHHVDPDMDVTTSFRFHPGEVLYSTAFRAVQIALIGVPLSTFIVYETVFNCATMFHHSNLRFPLGVERIINWVFVTPRMHGVHHSVIAEEANANYSVIFRWWDWANRTLRLNVPQDEIVIGVAGYAEAKDNGLAGLLMLPFRRERKDRTGPRHRKETTVPKMRMIS